MENTINLPSKKNQNQNQNPEEQTAKKTKTHFPNFNSELCMQIERTKLILPL